MFAWLSYTTRENSVSGSRARVTLNASSPPEAAGADVVQGKACRDRDREERHAALDGCADVSQRSARTVTGRPKRAEIARQHEHKDCDPEQFEVLLHGGHESSSAVEPLERLSAHQPVAASTPAAPNT